MGLSASVAGTITSSAGAYNQAQSQRTSLDYQASVASMNAKVAGWQASDALVNGQKAESNQDLKTASMMGTQRATLAANGVDLGSGNANDILTTTQVMGSRDAAQIHDNAMMQAWGYNTQQQNYLDNAQELKSMSGSINPLMSAGTSLLTGATNVSSQWDKLAKVNGTPNFSTTINNKWSSMWGTS